MRILLLLLFVFTLAGCGDQVGKLNSLERAEEMEEDLTERRRFYSAIEGTYEGVSQTGTSGRNLRVVFTQTLPDYASDRVRTLQELEYEFQNLAFNVQVTSWASAGAAFGCIFENVRPDIESGVINLVSQQCGNTYQFSLDGLESSSDLAFSILEGSSTRVGRLEAVIYSRNIADKMSASVERVQ